MKEGQTMAEPGRETGKERERKKSTQECRDFASWMSRES